MVPRGRSSAQPVCSKQVNFTSRTCMSHVERARSAHINARPTELQGVAFPVDDLWSNYWTDRHATSHGHLLCQTEVWVPPKLEILRPHTIPFCFSCAVILSIRLHAIAIKKDVCILCIGVRRLGPIYRARPTCMRDSARSSLSASDSRTKTSG